MRRHGRNASQAFYTIYLEDGDTSKDLHTMFAERLGTDRERAKQICYEIMYSSKFIKETIEANHAVTRNMKIPDTTPNTHKLNPLKFRGN